MEQNYQAYLLRFQRTSAQTNWRVMVKNAVSGEVHHFAHEREALGYLLQTLTHELPTEDMHEIEGDPSA